MYERLTKKFNAELLKNSDEIIHRAYCKLAELEDKIEQGTLVEFPCVKYQKEDNSWNLWFIDEYGNFDCYTYDDKEEAKARLKELNNERKSD